MINKKFLNMVAHFKDFQCDIINCDLACRVTQPMSPLRSNFNLGLRSRTTLLPWGDIGHVALHGGHHVYNIESDIVLFLDHTSILEKITDPIISIERINRDLYKLDAWSKQWLVKVNPAKTMYIVFSLKIQLAQYADLYIGREKLERVKQHKQLGVTFTEQMTFEMHIMQENCKKAINHLSALKALGSRIPRKGRLAIYVSFIRPVNSGFSHLKETHENSLKFANSLKDLEIHWNFIEYINILEHSWNLTKINYYLILTPIVIKVPTQNKLIL